MSSDRKIEKEVNSTPAHSDRTSRPSEPKKSSFCGDICSTLKMLFSLEMLKFWPQMIWTGISIAYWSGLLTPIMLMQQKQADDSKTDQEYLSKCLYAFIFFGVG
jgi:hypothetical protein